ncbi:MAG: Crp/Fnr family transcriptional regulator [Clostridiales bacterium]|nr:Crp/Fnr family transcriptional regulator [Clostridiales bacterium]
MKEYLNILKKCLLFKDLSDGEILNMLTCIDADIKKFSNDDYILRMGDITDSIGILLSGNALVIQEDLWGNRNIMTRLSSSDFFAEPYAAIPDAVLNVSVVATNDCEVMKINIHKMLTMCTSACTCHNHLIQNLVTAFAQKTLMFNDKITHMSKRKTRDKILSYLSAEAIRQKSVSFHIPFDRQQLADFLCVERSAMSAELSKLQKEGLIKTSHSHFELNINPVD